MLITWNIDSTNYTEEELNQLATFVGHFDSSIEKHIEHAIQQQEYKQEDMKTTTQH